MIPCPFCGKPARVLETRGQGTGIIVRTHLCTAEHRFTTEQTYVRLSKLREQRDKVVAKLVREGRRRDYICSVLKVDPSTVHRIVKRNKLVWNWRNK